MIPHRFHLYKLKISKEPIKNSKIHIIVQNKKQPNCLDLYIQILKEQL